MMFVSLFIMNLFAGKDCVDCSIPSPSSLGSTPAPITYILNNNCRRPLLTGQGRISQRSTTSNPNSIPANRNYLLHKSGESSYEIIFQLKFQSKTGQDSPVFMSAQDMEERTRNCLALIPPSRMPDGREISFRFITPQQKNLIIGQAPPLIEINVIRENRGNAENFGENFRCGHLIHELLHHAGLCDENRETGGASNIGKCRPQAPGTSVMNLGMHQAFDDSVGEPFQCSLPQDPIVRAWFENENFTHREFLYKRNFRSIGNRGWADFGYNQQRNDKPKEKCCRKIGETKKIEPLLSPESPKVKMVSNVMGDLRFKNYEDFIVDEFLGSTNKKYIIEETDYECSLNSVEPSLHQACNEYYELLKPEIESVSDPRRKIFTCRDGDILPPQDFEIAQGSFEISGSRVNFRNSSLGRPLLHSGHFERLIAGECSTPAAATYDKCSRFAYEHNYTNAQKAMSCHELLPEECKSIDWIGTITQ